MASEWRVGLLRKFPTLDVRWPVEVQDRWWRCFWTLLEEPS